jgi:hypothetical protein
VPACRGCGLDFSEWEEPEGGYQTLCKACRASSTQSGELEPTPRPSPYEANEHARSGAGRHDPRPTPSERAAAPTAQRDARATTATRPSAGSTEG